MARKPKNIYLKKTDEDTLSMLKKRFKEMDTERNSRLPERAMDDMQYNAPIMVDNSWKVIVNTQLEQSLIEMEEGRRAGMPTFDVKPDPYTANIAQTESAKYILDAFLDRENRHQELLLADQNGDKYGTAVTYDGLSVEAEIIKQPVKQEVDQDIGALIYGKLKTIDVVKENWFLTPKNVPLRYFWCDDKVLWQSDFRKAEDCFMAEVLSEDTFYQRYRDNPLYDQDAVMGCQPTQIDQPAYGVSSALGQYILYHYFNRISKKYCIMVNQSMLLLDTYMLYKHGELPFSVCQRYPNSGCIYGFGIPRKVRVRKGYKNNVLQSILDGARMNSGSMLAVSEFPTDGDMEVIPGGISLMQFNGGIEGISKIDTKVDLNASIAALGILDDEVRKDTGIDQTAPTWPQANTLGQTEIIEENKALRQRASDQLRDLWLDRMLTHTLYNIAQFAPHLLKKHTDVKVDGKVVGKASVRPQIQVQNVSVKKERGQIVIEEDYGNYGYLELTPETLDGDLTVRITTPSTWNKTLTSLAKDKAKELVSSYLELAQVFGPDALEAEWLTMKDVITQYKQAYGIEENMTPTTKKSLAKKKLKETAQKVKDLINLPAKPQTPNANPNQAPVQQADPKWALVGAQAMWGSSNTVLPAI